MEWRGSQESRCESPPGSPVTLKTPLKTQIIIAALVGAVVTCTGAFLVERKGDPASDIRAVEGRLQEAYTPKEIPVPASLVGKFTTITEVAPAWSEVEAVWEGLHWKNREIAKAKALLHYTESPEPYSYVWQDRQRIAAQAWFLEESGELWGRRATAAACGGTIAFAVSLGFLALVGWLWRFFLARLREISNAVRGKMDSGTSPSRSWS